MKLLKFKFTDLRLSHQITAITAALALTTLLGLTAFAAISTTKALQSEAERSFRAQVESLRQSADLAYKIAEQRTASITSLFQERFKSGLTIDATRRVQVAGMDTPLLKMGDVAVNMNFRLVDDFTDATGAAASVFVLKDDEFVRVTTSVKNDNGERAVGLSIGKGHQAYDALRNGKSYMGKSTVSGQDYLANYVPIRAADGSLIGALGVGYGLAEVKESLFQLISAAKLGESGYAYVVDSSPGKNLGRLLAHPSLVGKSILELADASGKVGFLRTLVETKSGVVNYPWPNADGIPESKVVAYERSEGWNWTIAGGASKEEQMRIGTHLALVLAVSGVVSAVVLAMLLWLFIARRFRPLAHLTQTVHRLAEGDNQARSNLLQNDEIGELGRAFDALMDERQAIQTAIERDNEQLNNSVLALLQSVAQLARKDLTIKVPVAEDVTGALGDALNMLTAETGKVLSKVTDLAADVSSSSLMVKQQSNEVTAAAESEQHEIDITTSELGAAAISMNRIAELAQSCNVAADNAIKTTRVALTTVTATVGGISSIRDTIRETEKKIKRLGERSQEISGVVGLINTIAERTHILALNASMHAASAGEAGRGFAVVAEEVQRLAENARQATAQIATLVNNIQIETSDAVNTMNTTISQVVEGSKLAEQAGEQMKLSQEVTNDLVTSVQQIAESSREQAQISSSLLERVGSIRISTEKTTQHLREQGEQTDHLVEYAKDLMGAVRVFKLSA